MSASLLDQDYDQETQTATGIKADNKMLSAPATDTSVSGQLNAQLEATANELLILNQIGQAVASSLNLSKTLTTITEGSLKLLRVEAVSVALLDNDQEHVEFVAAAGREDTFIIGKRLQVTEGILGWVVRNGQPAVVTDVTADSRHSPYFDQASGLQTHSILCIPLQAKGHTIGAINALNKLEGAFDQEDERLLTSLASPAATAIENARLYERARHEIAERKKAEVSLKQERALLSQRVEERTAQLQLQYKRQQALAAIEPIISQPSDLTLILKKLVTIAQTYLPVQAGASITLWDESTADFSVSISSGDTPATQATASDSQHTAISQAILEIQDIVVISDLAEASDDVRHWLQPYGIQSMVGIPIINLVKRFGVFYIFGLTPRIYTQEEIDFMLALSNRAGVAIATLNLYQSLQQSNQDLERAAKMKDEFLANMSHELRTPLNAILGIAEGLKGMYFGPLNEKQRESIQVIEDSGWHLLSLINDILDVAKVESGYLSLDIEWVKVRDICESSLQFVRQTALKKRISIGLNIGSSVDIIQADSRRLKQILINLLSNAVKFTDEKGAVGLNVSKDPATDDIRFVVWDTGVGIRSEDFPGLFQPFKQIDSSLGRRYSGTGLGLALVKRMTRLHDGHVAVESIVNQGSRFIVTLPAEQPNQDVRQPQDLPSQPATQPTTGIMAGAAATHEQSFVLVVDDDHANAALFEQLLSRRGFRVIIAHSSKEALETLQSTRPDIILMDIQMPEVDGLETIRRIRSQQSVRDIPIIAFTALAMAEDKERCLKAGANAYLSKPVPLSKLVETIQQCLC